MAGIKLSLNTMFEHKKNSSYVFIYGELAPARFEYSPQTANLSDGTQNFSLKSII